MHLYFSVSCMVYATVIPVHEPDFFRKRKRWLGKEGDKVPNTCMHMNGVSPMMPGVCSCRLHATALPFPSGSRLLLAMADSVAFGRKNTVDIVAILIKSGSEMEQQWANSEHEQKRNYKLRHIIQNSYTVTMELEE